MNSPINVERALSRSFAPPPRGAMKQAYEHHGAAGDDELGGVG